MIDILPGVHSTASALQAERLRMEVVSQNIANINTTRGPDGKPYQRQQLVFESVLQGELSGDLGVQPHLVKVTRVDHDHRPPKLIYNPGHPDANAEGLVAVPDINLHEEM